MVEKDKSFAEYKRRIEEKYYIAKNFRNDDFVKDGDNSRLLAVFNLDTKKANIKDISKENTLNIDRSKVNSIDFLVEAPTLESKPKDNAAANEPQENKELQKLLEKIGSSINEGHRDYSEIKNELLYLKDKVNDLCNGKEVSEVIKEITERQFNIENELVAKINYRNNDLENKISSNFLNQIIKEIKDNSKEIKNGLSEVKISLESMIIKEINRLNKDIDTNYEKNLDKLKAVTQAIDSIQSSEASRDIYKESDLIILVSKIDDLLKDDNKNYCEIKAELNSLKDKVSNLNSKKEATATVKEISNKEVSITPTAKSFNTNIAISEVAPAVTPEKNNNNNNMLAAVNSRNNDILRLEDKLENQIEHMKNFYNQMNHMNTYNHGNKDESYTKMYDVLANLENRLNNKIDNISKNNVNHSHAETENTYFSRMMMYDLFKNSLTNSNRQEVPTVNVMPASDNSELKDIRNLILDLYKNSVSKNDFLEYKFLNSQKHQEPRYNENFNQIKDSIVSLQKKLDSKKESESYVDLNSKHNNTLEVIKNSLSNLSSLNFSKDREENVNIFNLELLEAVKELSRKIDKKFASKEDLLRLNTDTISNEELLYSIKNFLNEVSFNIVSKNDFLELQDLIISSFNSKAEGLGDEAIDAIKVVVKELSNNHISKEDFLNLQSLIANIEAKSTSNRNIDTQAINNLKTLIGDLTSKSVSKEDFSNLQKLVSNIEISSNDKKNIDSKAINDLSKIVGELNSKNASREDILSLKKELKPVIDKSLTVNGEDNISVIKGILDKIYNINVKNLEDKSSKEGVNKDFYQDLQFIKNNISDLIKEQKNQISKQKEIENLIMSQKTVVVPAPAKPQVTTTTSQQTSVVATKTVNNVLAAKTAPAPEAKKVQESGNDSLNNAISKLKEALEMDIAPIPASAPTPTPVQTVKTVEQVEVKEEKKVIEKKDEKKSSSNDETIKLDYSKFFR